MRARANTKAINALKCLAATFFYYFFFFFFGSQIRGGGGGRRSNKKRQLSGHSLGRAEQKNTTATDRPTDLFLSCFSIVFFFAAVVFFFLLSSVDYKRTSVYNRRAAFATKESLEYKRKHYSLRR